METAQLIDILTGLPTALIFLYLFLREQKNHDETRRSIDAERREFWQHNATLAARVVEAVERLDLPGPRE